jgi:hypothetical protein
LVSFKDVPVLLHNKTKAIWVDSSKILPLREFFGVWTVLKQNEVVSGGKGGININLAVSGSDVF